VDGNQTLIWIVGIGLVMVLMILPQWQARRRQKKQMESIQAGSEVMTIGGIIGKVTYIDRDENRTRIEIAPGVEIEMLATAISRPVAPAEPPEEESEDSAAAEEE
jgi:preprotein translocase subunit YajC